MRYNVSIIYLTLLLLHSNACSKTDLSWTELTEVLTSHGEKIDTNDLDLLIGSLKKDIDDSKIESQPVDFLFSLLQL